MVSPVKEPQKVDMHIFREKAEDIYAGIEWEAGTPEAEKFYRFCMMKWEWKVRFPERNGTEYVRHVNMLWSAWSVR